MTPYCVRYVIDALIKYFPGKNRDLITGLFKAFPGFDQSLIVKNVTESQYKYFPSFLHSALTILKLSTTIVPSCIRN